VSSAPRPDAKKIGSRPTDRIARTGLLTPPGISPRARSKSSCERSWRRTSPSARSAISGLPLGIVLGEVPKPDLLVLGRGVERRTILTFQPANLRDAVEHRVALLLRTPMRHREDAVGPVGIGGPPVAMRPTPDRGHARADGRDLILGHLPDSHSVRRKAGAAVEQNRRDT